MRRGVIISAALLLTGCGAAWDTRPHAAPATLDPDVLLPPAWHFCAPAAGYAQLAETAERSGGDIAVFAGGSLITGLFPDGACLYPRYAKLRTELFPYVYSYAHRARLEGTNILSPSDSLACGYLFGSEFLVGPVCEKGVRSLTLRLPDGIWIDYRTGKRYMGGKTHILPVTPEDIPLLVRDGAVIPKCSHSRSVAEGGSDTLVLEVFSGMGGSFTLIEDDGRSDDYLKGIYAVTEISAELSAGGLTIRIAPVAGYYEGMPKQRAWRLSFPGVNEISKVSVNGKSIGFETTGSGVITDYFTQRRSKSVKIETEFP